ncbi:hypothetical protein ACVWZ4_000827 [Bradyrhizobium sp. USDA 4472]
MKGRKKYRGPLNPEAVAMIKKLARDEQLHQHQIAAQLEIKAVSTRSSTGSASRRLTRRLENR